MSNASVTESLMPLPPSGGKGLCLAMGVALPHLRATKGRLRSIP